MKKKVHTKSKVLAVLDKKCPLKIIIKRGRTRDYNEYLSIKNRSYDKIWRQRHVFCQWLGGYVWIAAALLNSMSDVGPRRLQDLPASPGKKKYIFPFKFNRWINIVCSARNQFALWRSCVQTLAREMPQKVNDGSRVLNIVVFRKTQHLMNTRYVKKQAVRVLDR